MRRVNTEVSSAADMLWDDLWDENVSQGSSTTFDRPEQWQRHYVHYQDHSGRKSYSDGKKRCNDGRFQGTGNYGNQNNQNSQHPPKCRRLDEENGERQRVGYRRDNDDRSNRGLRYNDQQEDNHQKEGDEREFRSRERVYSHLNHEIRNRPKDSAYGIQKNAWIRDESNRASREMKHPRGSEHRDQTAWCRRISLNSRKYEIQETSLLQDCRNQNQMQELADNSLQCGRQVQPAFSGTQSSSYLRPSINQAVHRDHMVFQNNQENPKLDVTPEVNFSTTQVSQMEQKSEPLAKRPNLSTSQRRKALMAKLLETGEQFDPAKWRRGKKKKHKTVQASESSGTVGSLQDKTAWCRRISLNSRKFEIQETSLVQDCRNQNHMQELADNSLQCGPRVQPAFSGTQSSSYLQPSINQADHRDHTVFQNNQENPKLDVTPEVTFSTTQVSQMEQKSEPLAKRPNLSTSQRRKALMAKLLETGEQFDPAKWRRGKKKKHKTVQASESSGTVGSLQDETAWLKGNDMNSSKELADQSLLWGRKVEMNLQTRPAFSGVESCAYPQPSTTQAAQGHHMVFQNNQKNPKLEATPEVVSTTTQVAQLPEMEQQSEPLVKRPNLSTSQRRKAIIAKLLEKGETFDPAKWRRGKKRKHKRPQGETSDTNMCLEVEAKVDKCPRGNMATTPSADKLPEKSWGETHRSDQEQTQKKPGTSRKRVFYGDNSAIKMAIVLEDYPEAQITAKQREVIEDAIMDEVQPFEDGSGPSFTGTYLENGALITSCINEPTKCWLEALIPRLNPLGEGCKLKIVSRKNILKLTRVFFRAHPKLLKKTPEDVIEMLDKQNPTFKVDKWRVLPAVPDAKGYGFVCFLDNNCINAVKSANCRANLGLWQVTIVSTLIKDNSQGSAGETSKETEKATPEFDLLATEVAPTLTVSTIKEIPQGPAGKTSNETEKATREVNLLATQFVPALTVSTSIKENAQDSTGKSPNETEKTIPEVDLLATQAAPAVTVSTTIKENSQGPTGEIPNETEKATPEVDLLATQAAPALTVSTAIKENSQGPTGETSNKTEKEMPVVDLLAMQAAPALTVSTAIKENSQGPTGETPNKTEKATPEVDLLATQAAPALTVSTAIKENSQGPTGETPNKTEKATLEVDLLATQAAPALTVSTAIKENSQGPTDETPNKTEKATLEVDLLATQAAPALTVSTAIKENSQGPTGETPNKTEKATPEVDLLATQIPSEQNP